MRRRKASRGSRKQFSRTAMKEHGRNGSGPRGGWRL